MTEVKEQEIIKHINNGAKHYIRMFANAEHMETFETEYYCYIKPKAGEHGIRFVFDIKMENLPSEKQNELVKEIKDLQMPIWLDLDASDEVFRMFFGKEKVHGQTMFKEDDEIYMAVLAEEWQECVGTNCGIDEAGNENGVKVVKVKNIKDFSVWAKINNDILAGGFADMHPVYHYPLCEKGCLDCYIAYDKEGTPVSIASVMNNNGTASLEFVATVTEARRKGFAQAVCERAVADAFESGAKLVTVRAANLVAGRLYGRIGFKAYNYVL